MEKDNTTSVLTRFMAALAIPVTRQTISDELEKHPDYNSLLNFSTKNNKTKWIAAQHRYGCCLLIMAENTYPKTTRPLFY